MPPRPTFPTRFLRIGLNLIGPIGFLPLQPSSPNILLDLRTVAFDRSYNCAGICSTNEQILLPRTISSFDADLHHTSTPHHPPVRPRNLPPSYAMNHDGDDDRSSSTPTATSKSASGQEKEKPRLTDQEKKNNHIASEQKRRAAIREGFDRLTELVPGLEGQGRSESIVLQKTVDFIHLKLQERQNLIAEIENKGGRVDDSFRPS